MKLSNKKIIRLIVSGIIALVIYFIIIRPITLSIKYHYRVVKNDYRHYFWLLNDSVQLDSSTMPDTLFAVTGQVRKTDQYFNYNLRGQIHINIFEYKDLDNLKLNEVKFNYKRDFPSFKNIYGTVLNEGVEKCPVITVKDKLPFHHSLKVDFNKNAHLKVIRNTDSYKVYFGKLTKMLLSNNENDPLVLFDLHTVPNNILIAFYTARSKFLIIIITSDRTPMNANYIHLLKLE